MMITIEKILIARTVKFIFKKKLNWPNAFAISNRSVDYFEKFKISRQLKWSHSFEHFAARLIATAVDVQI